MSQAPALAVNGERRQQERIGIATPGLLWTLWALPVIYYIFYYHNLLLLIVVVVVVFPLLLLLLLLGYCVDFLGDVGNLLGDGADLVGDVVDIFGDGVDLLGKIVIIIIKPSSNDQHNRRSKS